MRLDLFLSRLGIVKRRTEAARLLREGRVLVNEQAAKPATTIHPGQSLRVIGSRRVTWWSVLAIPEGNVRKSDYDRFVQLEGDETRESE